MSDSSENVENSEQTTPQQTSSEEPKITTTPVKKEKDPKKVAQGKRLAQISKAAKEKKMREQIRNENSIDFSVDYKSVLYVAGSATLVFAGMYLYFAQKDKKPQTTVSPEPKKTVFKPPQTQPKKFVSLFD